MAETEYESASSSCEEDNCEEPTFKIKSKQDNSSIVNLYTTYLKDNRINLKPAYQRNFCWSSSQQELLIDSLINGYPIPSILIAETGTYKWECIDGQHRLYTIQQFIENKFAYKDVNTGTYYYYEAEDRRPIGFEKRKQRKYSHLTDEMKDDFDHRQICIIIIAKETKLSDYHKRVLFQRLQNGTRISAVHRIKNIDSPITNHLSSMHYMNLPVWKQFTELYQPHTKVNKRINENTDQIDSYCFMCLLRIILSYKLDTTTSCTVGYLNNTTNIRKSLHYKNCLKENEVEVCLTEFGEFIAILHATKTKYCEPYLLILFNIYKNFGQVRLLQVLAKADNNDKYNKHHTSSNGKNGIIDNTQLSVNYSELIKFT